MLSYLNKHIDVGDERYQVPLGLHIWRAHLFSDPVECGLKYSPK